MGKKWCLLSALLIYYNKRVLRRPVEPTDSKALINLQFKDDLFDLLNVRNNSVSCHFIKKSELTAIC